MIKRLRHPEPFTYWWFFNVIRKEQGKHKFIKSIREFLGRHIAVISMIIFLSLFSNIILYLFLVAFSLVGILELFLLKKAFVLQNMTYFKNIRIQKARRKVKKAKAKSP